MPEMTADAGSSGVNRFVADSSLADREARAIFRFIRRDPKVWTRLLVSALFYTALASAVIWLMRDDRYWVTLLGL